MRKLSSDASVFVSRMMFGEHDDRVLRRNKIL